MLLTLSTNNSTILKTAIIFAEGIFDDETHVVHPKKEDISSKLIIPLLPPKDISLDIHIRVSYRSRYLNQYYMMLWPNLVNLYSLNKVSALNKLNKPVLFSPS